MGCLYSLSMNRKVFKQKVALDNLMDAEYDAKNK